MSTAVRTRWTTLGVTSAALFMAFLDTTVMTVAFPALQRAFEEASFTTLAWVLNVYTLVFATLVIPGGRLGDRLGRRRCFLGGLALFAGASAACAGATSAGELIAARAVQASGAALFVPNSLALLLPQFAPHQRASAIGLWGAMGGLAAALGPIVGGSILTSADWRWIFALNVPLSMAVMLLAAACLQERSRSPADHGDPLALPLLSLGLGAAVLAVMHGPSWHWSSLRVLSAFAAAGVLLGLFAWRCRRKPDRVMEAYLLRTRSFAVANVAFALFALGVFAALLGNVLFLTTVWEFSALKAGLAVSPSAVLALVLAVPAGHASNRWGEGVIAAFGCLTFSCACVLAAVLIGQTPSLDVWLPLNALLGVAGALALASLGSASMRSVPFDRLSTGAAISTCARQLGGVIGVAVLVMVLQANADQVLDGFHTAWGVLAVSGIAAAFVAMALPKPNRGGR